MSESKTKTLSVAQIIALNMPKDHLDKTKFIIVKHQLGKLYYFCIDKKWRSTIIIDKEIEKTPSRKIECIGVYSDIDFAINCAHKLSKEAYVIKMPNIMVEL